MTPDIVTSSPAPSARRLGKVFAERPPDDPEALERTSCILWVACVDEMTLLGTALVIGVEPFL